MVLINNLISRVGLVLFVFLLSAQCNTGDTTSTSESATESNPQENVAIDSTITIATFNIQIFGKTKMSKTEVVQQLVNIVRKYDIVAIQEFKDASGETPPKFLEEINKSDPGYDYVISPRTGLQEDDKSSREQYGYYYNTETIELLNEGILFNDSINDFFQREPFLAQFKAKNGNFTFVLSSIHTRPESAIEEIGALHDVIEWAKTQFVEEEDFITLGDFNAGCDYASVDELNNLVLRGEDYIWVVPDSADTNFSPNTECAYDRIVLTLGANEYFTGEWGIDYSIDDKAISDHYPVWANFKISLED